MAELSVLSTRISEAAETIMSLHPERPSIAIVLGSGLGPMADRCEVLASIPFAEIPHFPVPTTPGHAGKLLIARVGNVPVYFMQGRYHFYEGYTTQEITFPYRVLAHLGMKQLILTNAAGGLNPDWNPGDLMVLSDHLSLFCDSPLRGANLDAFGPRFPDQTHVYDSDLRELLLETARELSVPVHAGVYAYMRGPQYETPAEIRMLRSLGADAVGMSTVPEAIVASHSGVKILALSCITNLAAGISKTPLSHKEVMEIGAQASDSSIRLLQSFLSKI